MCVKHYYHYIYLGITTFSAEVLKAAMQKTSSGSANASPVLPARGNIPSSSTLLVKKSGASGNTLTPLGPLGLSLRDDDTASTSPVRTRRQPPAADTGYTADELQVLRYNTINQSLFVSGNKNPYYIIV